jgi:hypothetical protein
VAALTAFEADLARAEEAARVAAERLHQATQARQAAAATDATTAAATDAASAASPAAPSLAATAVASAPASRSWLRQLFARFVAFVLALFGRSPAPSLPGAAGSSRAPARPVDELAALEAELATARARVATLGGERDECRRLLETYHADRTRRGRARLVELTSSSAPSWTELDIDAPELPPDVVLLLRPPVLPPDREPTDATLFADTQAVATPLGDERPVLRAQLPLAHAALVGQLQLIREQRTAALARRVVATLCLCRNRIVDLDRHARAAHDERTRELGARRVPQADTVRREESNAQLPIARHAEKIVHDAAARLEQLLQEVRAAWERRIESCAGSEQLRAEVAAIEDGAAHRLALVCDELRETLTIQFVRLVLELSRPPRHELMRKRLEVARGRSPTLEQSFDDIRVVLPASLDKTFGALVTPEIGELLTEERSLFDPLFRTLARQKRQCVTRMSARLDDIGRATTRDLYAAAVYVSPLLLGTFKGLVGELVRAHEGWIDTLVAEEELAWQKLCARHAPALELVNPLDVAETKLAALLEVA